MLVRALLVAVVPFIAACAADPAQSCTSLCTGSGFETGTADVQSNEVNCFCAGGDGAGAVSADDCTAMCGEIGRGAGEVFGSGAGATANACQCS